MSTAESPIEWTDRTWNPVRGCALVSPGCTHCYAMRVAHRFSGAGKPYEGLSRARKSLGPVWTGTVKEIPSALSEPFGWKAPKRVFVNSMSDLFHEYVSNEFIAAVFGVMAATPHHTFQVLTKRPERMRGWFEWVSERGEQGRAMFPDDVESWRIGQLLAVQARRLGNVSGYRRGTRATGWEDFDPRRQPWPLFNTWLGVSVEDRAHGLPRIDALREVPAALRFLSIEPLLEDLGALDLRGIGWVIVGGESGPSARLCRVEWVRAIVEQCREQGVPVFVKQLGSAVAGDWGPGKLPQIDPRLPRRRDWVLGDAKGGDPSEWPADLRVREMPEVHRE